MRILLLQARRCSRRLLGAALGAAVASHGWRPGDMVVILGLKLKVIGGFMNNL